MALAVPANDNFANREVISALPFDDAEPDIGTATVETTDPIVFCRAGAAGQGGNTVWYSYTTGAATEYLNFSTATSNYDTMVSVYEGTPSPATLITGGCSDDGVPATLQSRMAGVRLEPGTSYSIEVARFTASAAVVTLNFNVTAAPLYQVSKPDDTADGTCDADCSLREAITAANAAPGAVLLPADDYDLMLAGAEELNATGDLDVRSGMGIWGAGPSQSIVDAGDLDRVLHVDPAASGRVTLGLADITLRNGTATGDGGGVLVAGGGNFVDLEQAFINDSVASGNGGGLRSPARGRLRRSVVSGNQAAAAGGGLSLASTDAVYEIRDSTVHTNTSQASATAGGGGVHSTARTSIVNSTIAGNRANFDGGGLHFLSTGQPALLSSTVANNTADFDANDTGTGGGAHFGSTGATTVNNSVLANNTDNNATAAPDCAKSNIGTLTTSFSHLEATAGGCLFTGTGDVTGSDPNISSTLADNGGLTGTLAVAAGSPLIDTANPSACLDGNALELAFDQRGSPFARSVDGNGDSTPVCDKGAFEFIPSSVPPGGGNPGGGGPGGGTPGGGQSGRDTTPPVVSRLAARQRRRSLGFTLSENARVTARLFRELPGVRRGRRCVKPRRGQRGGRKCKRRVRVKSYVRSGRAGANTLPLGRLKRRRYVVVVTAVDAAGNRSRAVTRRLTLGR